MAEKLKIEIVASGSSSVKREAATSERALRGIDDETVRIHERVTKSGRAFSTFGKMGKAGFRAAATGAKVAGFGIAALGVVEIPRMIEEAREANKVTAQTEAALKSTGASAWTNASAISNLSNKLSLKAGVDDEVIQSGANLMLTFREVHNEAGKGNKIFDRSVTTATDLSAAMGKDLQSSILMVGKALNDPVKGAGALSRAGVQLTEQQKSQIETFVESGQTMKAQKVILGELDKQFGGSAAAQADAGDKLKVAWQNLEETAGKALVPIFSKLAVGAAQFFNEMSAGTGTGGKVRDVLVSVGGAIGTAFGGVKVGVQWVKQAISTVSEFADTFSHDENVIVFASAVRNVGRAVLSVAVPAFKILLAGAKAALGPLKTLFTGVATVVKGVVQVVSGILTGQWGKAWEGVKNIVSGSVNVVKGLLGLLVEDVKTRFKLALLAVDKLTAPFRAAASAVFRGVVSVAKQILRGLVAVVKAPFVLTVAAIRGFVALHKAAAQLVAKGIVSAFNIVSGIAGDVSRAFRSAWGAIKGWVGNLKSAGSSAGSAIKDAVVNGLSGVVSAVAGIGADIGSAILDAVKGFLGISSPSKEFEKIGRHMLDGLANGISPGDVSNVIGKAFGSVPELAWTLIKAGTITVPKALLEGVYNKLHDVPGLGVSLDAFAGATGWSVNALKNAWGWTKGAAHAATHPWELLARGGVTDKPTAGIFGEAGREYFIPAHAHANKARSRSLLQDAASDLGMVAFADGGAAGRRNPVRPSFKGKKGAPLGALEAALAKAESTKGGPAATAAGDPNFPASDFDAAAGTLDDYKAATKLLGYWTHQAAKYSKKQIVHWTTSETIKHGKNKGKTKKVHHKKKTMLWDKLTEAYQQKKSYRDYLDALFTPEEDAFAVGGKEAQLRAALSAAALTGAGSGVPSAMAAGDARFPSPKYTAAEGTLDDYQAINALISYWSGRAAYWSQPHSQPGKSGKAMDFEKLTTARDNWKSYLDQQTALFEEADTAAVGGGDDGALAAAQDLAALRAEEIADLQRQLNVEHRQSPVYAQFAGSFKDGGVIPRDGLAYVHKGEEVTPKDEVGRGGGVTVVLSDPILSALDPRIDVRAEDAMNGAARSAGLGRQTPSRPGRRASTTQGRRRRR